MSSRLAEVQRLYATNDVRSWFLAFLLTWWYLFFESCVIAVWCFLWREGLDYFASELVCDESGEFCTWGPWWLAPLATGIGVATHALILVLASRRPDACLATLTSYVLPSILLTGVMPDYGFIIGQAVMAAAFT